MVKTKFSLLILYQFDWIENSINLYFINERLRNPKLLFIYGPLSHVMNLVDVTVSVSRLSYIAMTLAIFYFLPFPGSVKTQLISLQSSSSKGCPCFSNSLAMPFLSLCLILHLFLWTHSSWKEVFINRFNPYDV